MQDVENSIRRGCLFPCPLENSFYISTRIFMRNFAYSCYPVDLLWFISIAIFFWFSVTFQKRPYFVKQILCSQHCHSNLNLWSIFNSDEIQLFHYCIWQSPDLSILQVFLAWENQSRCEWSWTIWTRIVWMRFLHR